MSGHREHPFCAHSEPAQGFWSWESVLLIWNCFNLDRDFECLILFKKLNVQAFIYITMRSRCTSFHRIWMCFEGAVEAAISGLFGCRKTPPGTIVWLHALVASHFVNTCSKKPYHRFCTSQWPLLNSDHMRKNTEQWLYRNDLLGHESTDWAPHLSWVTVKGLQTGRLGTWVAWVFEWPEPFISVPSLSSLAHPVRQLCPFISQKLWASNELMKSDSFSKHIIKYLCNRGRSYEGRT